MSGNYPHKTEPDNGKLLIGRFAYIKLMAQNLQNAISEPFSTNDVLIYPEPVMADVLGTDYLEGSVEAAVGTTASNSITKSFTSIITNTMKVSGIVQVGVSVYLSLAQVDATYAGSVVVNDITVELLSYDPVSGNSVSLGSKTKTITKSISGVAAANVTFSESFTFKADSWILSKRRLLVLKVTVNFSATTDASATTTTIAKARINFARGSDETFVYLPVV